MAISLSNQVDYLFKKALGAPDTVPSVLSYVQELTIFSKPSSYLSQIYAQSIPTTPPSDFSISIGTNIAASRSYPYIYKYTELMLSPTFNGASNSFISSNLVGMIPAAVNSKYLYSILTHDKTSVISTNPTYANTIVIDSDTGILTFFTYPSLYTGNAAVTASQPPFVTFYRYVGLTGNPGISQVDNY